MINPASAVVLAGGLSRRLGQDKRLVRLQHDLTLLEQTVRRVTSLSDDVIVVGSKLPTDVDLTAARTAPDFVAGRGPLSGIVAGLTAARYPRALVVACDLPFLCPAALRAMLDVGTREDLLVPRRADGTLEMLHALYRTDCVDVAKRLLASNRLKLAELAEALIQDGRGVRFLDDHFFRPFDPSLSTFFNVNAPDDLAFAKRRYNSC